MVLCNSCKPNCSSLFLPQQELDLYLLIGQSNMAGRATIGLTERDTLQNVFLYTGNRGCPWIRAANPLNAFSTVHRGRRLQALGPGYFFASYLHEQDPETGIGLIVNAREGTSIAEWMPGTVCYNEAVARTKKAIHYGRLKAIIWHQGENDAEDASAYAPKLTLLIRELRHEFNDPELPFLAGEIASSTPASKLFNQLLQELPKRVDRTALISSDGLSTFDCVHFDATSVRTLGIRYAESLKKLQGKK